MVAKLALLVILAAEKRFDSKLDVNLQWLLCCHFAGIVLVAARQAQVKNLMA